MHQAWVACDSGPVHTKQDVFETAYFSVPEYRLHS